MRESFIGLRRAMDREEKARRDAAICEAATSLVSFRYAHIDNFHAIRTDFHPFL